MARLLFPFLTAFVASFAALVILLRSGKAGRNAARRLASIQKVAHAESRDTAALTKEDPWGHVEWLDSFLAHHGPGRTCKTLLVHAGSSMSLSAFLLMSGTLAVSTSLITLFVWQALWIAIAAFAGAAASPAMVLRIRRGKRVKAFNSALPDAIDLMSRSLAAGHSVPSSIEMLGQQAP